MTPTIEEKIIDCEQQLIQLKTQSFSSADSARLYRLFLDFGDVDENRAYTITLAPVNGNYDDLIVMPLGSTGAAFGVAFFPEGVGLDINNQCIIHFARIVDGALDPYPYAARSITIFSNSELRVDSMTYTPFQPL